MEKIKTDIKDVYIIRLDKHFDDRGWFIESYNEDSFRKIGIKDNFVQDNYSYTKHKGTIRGIHFQKAPYSQSKLIRCTRGKIMDIIVDLRKSSKAYGSYVAIPLDSEIPEMIYIPEGMGHAFLTLTDDVEFSYKCNNFYNKSSEGGIRYDDPDINVPWYSYINVEKFILSDKDLNAPLLKDCSANF